MLKILVCSGQSLSAQWGGPRKDLGFDQEHEQDEE
jgi:hypothetical protein